MSTIPARRLWQGAFLALALGAILAVFLILMLPAQVAGQSEAPAKPTGLRVSTTDGSLEVSVDWNDVSGATSYLVRWRERSEGSSLNTGITVTDSSATITVAESGEWIVRVEACTEDGCGRGVGKVFEVTAAEPEETPTPTPTPTPATTTFALSQHGRGTIPATIRDGVLEWDTFTRTASSTLHIRLKAVDDDLPRQTGGNGNYFVRIERASGSDSGIRIAPACVEFPAGGGASTGSEIRFSVELFFSFQGKSAEFSVYETTGETDCTDVRETDDPVFTPGKIVIDVPPHAPLTTPGRINLVEGQTHNTTGLPALAPDPVNRVRVGVTRLGDDNVTLTPMEFWIEPENYDLSRWPNLQITARPDADTTNDDTWFVFELWRGSRYITYGSIQVIVRDTTIVPPAPAPTPGIAVQADGLAAYVKPSANLKDADRQLEITDGETVDLRVRLTQAPDANLTLSAFLGRLHSSETRLGGVTITPGRLTFTPSNWDTWQTMSISAVAGAGERGMIYLDARVPSGDPDYAPSQDVSFDIALFRIAAVDPAPPPGGTGTSCDVETTVSTELACLNNLAQSIQDRITLLSQ
ncbi:MAG: hypothetical protein OXL37_11825 [Chloroflexota bacterium]|nr:hypothetical protein [Chloroflexota bacterium]MDE2958722.1 hypothetical protein [Chloroflexota bacterium]